jgi:hypothetical protein
MACMKRPSYVCNAADRCSACEVTRVRRSLSSYRLNIKILLPGHYKSWNSATSLQLFCGNRPTTHNMWKKLQPSDYQS